MARERITSTVAWLGPAAAALLWLAVFASWIAADAADGACGLPAEVASVDVAYGALLAALPLNGAALALARGGAPARARRVAAWALALTVLGLAGAFSASFFTACWE